ncbi:hypothetical protein MPK67_gp040 [Erwinia phage pEa_SNUABM_32]|uniref:Uncharacterized protein n=2 Tax=Alexandravirus TaxID=2733088 RepID=A0AAE7XIS4_9CAUD|nr:hypothetical protein MPK67_gp040 [Erwinia phage pEa_SNUABM_32]YP_010301153.1 hypothetical protein MPK68_gp040 [Erwinia phage pEa_SNUABM_3]QZE56577.1 hypothetical protein pEaSNUABM20_00041 [Erwinia phage pEa_SNUABM_20]QZE58256.1 hypothetical protein pEaSNUABM40_00040 [Erwinia phage pEa_SNUABM_40]UAW52822.1 hypothetical protein pEaSNUABM23_00040 [Erwinia phage pEa_SNUABM_23]UIW10718.1 hypothetical protein pEaSNUABM23_00040 [Erwinia phage pEa_SNUABM_31]QZE56237.1 hypothetical protein pEaSNUAB
MQTAYRCKHCKYVHIGKVSSCDCQGSKRFEYTLVQIIDVPEAEEQIPQFKDLKHSRAQRYVNVKDGTYGNGIYELREKREGERYWWTHLGTMQSGLDSTDASYKMCEDNRKANVVLAAAGPVMLEALYMCYQYFNLKREVQGSSIKNDSRISIIADAIRQGTDLSVFDTLQHPKE